MKKYLFIICMLLSSTSMFADKGDAWVGFTGNYCFESDLSRFGVGAKAQYEFIDNIRGELNATYYLKKDGYQNTDVGLDFHYLITLFKRDFNLYPLAGLVYRHEKFYDGDKNDAIGVTAGVGFEFPISPRVKFNTELRYIYLEDCYLSAGVAFTL